MVRNTTAATHARSCPTSIVCWLPLWQRPKPLIDYLQKLTDACIVTIMDIDKLDRIVIIDVDKALGICELQPDCNLQTSLDPEGNVNFGQKP